MEASHISEPITIVSHRHHSLNEICFIIKPILDSPPLSNTSNAHRLARMVWLFRASQAGSDNLTTDRELMIEHHSTMPIVSILEDFSIKCNKYPKIFIKS